MNEAELTALLTQWRATKAPEFLGELLKSYRDQAYAVALRMTAGAGHASESESSRSRRPTCFQGAHT